ncbi:MAG: tRNA (N(6)-L-threonylcarbamoyladenosine(37)-C(2))-methylthiotransferase [Euryarchaeota archaeon]|nr:tRNA (N(6)-L-threonylcarbamoyladenosine(37)-C(2))-methylthiotransferase [Euryarchaeota archaeon]
MIARRIEELKDKKIIVASCPNLISDAINSVANGRRFVNISDAVLEKSCMYKRRKNRAVAVVPISEGCLGMCSYCATKFVRGKLRSSGIASVVKEVEDVVRHGYREIQLTAQDTAAYGIDIEESLPELLRRVCEVGGDFKARVGMMNPGFALEILDELIDSYRNEKIYKFVHIPVQSGDDAILEKMKRNYCVEDFLEVVRAFRKIGAMLSTDVIVGYPSESEKSFTKTYRLMEDIEPDVLNVKKFSPRPKTPAAKLKDMPDRIKKERSRKLALLHAKIALEKNKRCIGKEFEVLVTEFGKNNTMLARTNSYKQVVLQGANLGEFLKVKIKDAMPSYLIADSDF